MTTAVEITGLAVAWVGICEIALFMAWAWRDRRD